MEESYETVGELGVQRQEGSKIVPYFPFLLCNQGMYFTPLEAEPEVILKDLAVKQIGVQLLLSAGLNENVRKMKLKLLHLLQF